MPKYKLFISLLFFTLSFFCCKAQEGNKYVYQDSAAQPANTAVVKDNEVQPEADSAATANNVFLPDTILRLNNLTLSPDSIRGLKNEKAFGYAKNLDSLLKAIREKAKKNDVVPKDVLNKSDWLEKILSSSITTKLLWSLAGLFILFVVYKLFFVEGSFLKSKPGKSKVNELAGDETKMDSQNYNKLIALAITNKDYRLAVRYLYLHSLQCLSENGLVKLEPEKTNYQYINELNTLPDKDGFTLLTLNYEYVWYGGFAVSEEMFTMLKNNFEQFNNRLQKK